MFNDLLTIVANDYRRCLLLTLLERDRNRERDVRLPDDVAISGAKRDEQVAELRHCHLPMLASGDLIEWHQEDNWVAKGSRFDDIEPLLRLLYDHGDELPDRWLETPVAAK
ncbi:ArsR family transcriptional regulator [Natrinema sp. 1APR25-10V2]|uniref:ArsR family transcriptional regulator n=1 Tax=Natrinema sp. 1APR25-10V2 TaxID=2951081 RepID=UPI0028744DFC|nr:ArsR family transcriptional regulator [Natrinema sp. 1APR25-10V2]MDS0475759.1 ArsR family transcriptional regulator [Natrinema sp. 1APR25-10V2]